MLGFLCGVLLQLLTCAYITYLAIEYEDDIICYKENSFEVCVVFLVVFFCLFFLFVFCFFLFIIKLFMKKKTKDLSRMAYCLYCCPFKFESRLLKIR